MSTRGKSSASSCARSGSLFIARPSSSSAHSSKAARCEAPSGGSVSGLGRIFGFGVQTPSLQGNDDLQDHSPLQPDQRSIQPNTDLQVCGSSQAQMPASSPDSSKQKSSRSL